MIDCQTYKSVPKNWENQFELKPESINAIFFKIKYNIPSRNIKNNNNYATAP